MTIEEKKQFLKSYRKIDLQIRAAKEHLEEVSVLLHSPRLDCETRGQKADVSDTVIKIDQARAVLIRGIDKKIKTLERIETAINGLENINECLVMQLHYQNGLTFEDVAEKMSYSWRQIIRIHGNALEHINLD